jgi:hypothetical protein
MCLDPASTHTYAFKNLQSTYVFKPQQTLSELVSKGGFLDANFQGKKNAVFVHSTFDKEQHVFKTGDINNTHINK